MKSKLDWKKIEKDVKKAVKESTPKRFALTAVIAKKMYQDKVYPDATYDAVHVRVYTILGKKWEWPKYSTSRKGSCFVIPDGWG